MKKNNSKGFILLETLITSTVVISVLIFLYVQFSNIKRSYDDSFKINTIPGLYGALDIKKYLNNTGYGNLKIALSSSTIGYIEVNSANVNGDSLYYDELVDKLNVDKILFVEENMESFKTFLSNSSNAKIFSAEFSKYINKISVSNLDNKYRLVIIYKDDTYTSIIVD